MGCAVALAASCSPRCGAGADGRAGRRRRVRGRARLRLRPRARGDDAGEDDVSAKLREVEAQAAALRLELERRKEQAAAAEAAEAEAAGEGDAGEGGAGAKRRTRGRTYTQMQVDRGVGGLEQAIGYVNRGARGISEVEVLSVDQETEAEAAERGASFRRNFIAWAVGTVAVVGLSQVRLPTPRPDRPTWFYLISALRLQRQLEGLRQVRARGPQEPARPRRPLARAR